jgi:hypothetical protein
VLTKLWIGILSICGVPASKFDDVRREDFGHGRHGRSENRYLTWKNRRIMGERKKNLPISLRDL